ncbi:hypothetical protein CEUSTIGMA_g3509.t1 [Chlamydomonas eustigma]|uniref:Flagellar associated protein n=1 Tax=Chlamydomonas eustigma TaxID=1157962 RepID=A0A250WZ57_9CHLO|nr:hypothetical protein CEUSTIGMA_g3509.t1 [Chlamydomonas eustigma]|eukprot:GAX76066.1 hypothetical protein CEUSTIGMA_g3509.t1 [Chlamydomonas eustigma]
MAFEVAGSKTTFGEQILSTKPTSAKANFGSSYRTEKMYEKTFEHKLLGGTSKGVTTEVKSGFGHQVASHNINAPLSTFGNRYPTDADMVKEAMPGPGSYDSIQTAVGKQKLSQNPNLPEYRIGTGGRFGQFKSQFKKEYMTPAANDFRPASGWLGDAPNYSFHGKGRRADISNGLSGQRPTCSDDPGPGTYEPPMSIGPQIDSRKHSSQRTRVGTADRDVRFKQYVSKEHEGDLFGKHSPAPNKYNPSIRPLSRVRTPQSFAFGTGDRFSEIKSDNGRVLKVWTPGPGTYVV